MAANPSTANAHEQLISRLLANLPSGHTSSTVKLPNRAFNTPLNSKWLRPTVINQTSENTQAGGLWKRYEFLFIVDSFYPTGSNDLTQLAEAELIAAVFENERFSGVKCQEALIEVQGEEASWYHVQITIDGYYEGQN